MESRDLFCLKENFQYCMHACGSIYDLMFTNSLDAFEFWHKQGIKFFEIDIDDTENGKFVACHNFGKETFKKMEIEELPEQCTYEWFKQQKLYKRSTVGLTPMTLEDIFKLLCKYPDICFMIDPKVYSYKSTYTLLSAIKYYKNLLRIDGSRLIFEMYNEDMIGAAKEYKGELLYQYCMDDEMQMGSSEKMRKWELKKVINFLKENDIYIVSYPWKFAVRNLEVLKRLSEEAFYIFSKTRNNILAELLKKAGVNINIVDYLVTDLQRKELENYKNNYFLEYEEKIDKLFEIGNQVDKKEMSKG